MLPLGYIQHRDCCCLLMPNWVHRNDCLDSLQGKERHFGVTGIDLQLTGIDLQLIFPTRHFLHVHIQEYKTHLKAMCS